MAILVVAEHDNKTVRKATLNAVAAAQKLGADIHVLVAGHQAGDAAKAAGQVAGVKKALHADAAHLGEFLAENKFLVGLSIDGPRELHDRYRVEKGGQPTFAKDPAKYAKN